MPYTVHPPLAHETMVAVVADFFLMLMVEIVETIVRVPIGFCTLYTYSCTSVCPWLWPRKIWKNYPIGTFFISVFLTQVMSQPFRREKT